MSIVAKKIMMGSGAVGDPVDDQWNRTSFLSHFDGANNGVNSVFDDGSTSNHTMTVYGDATQGSFGPFARPDGEWAVDFDGNGDYLTLPNTLTRFTIANKDSQAATFEAFVFVKAYTANGNADYYNASIYIKGDIYLNFSISPEGYVDFYHFDGSVRLLSTSVAVALNTWTHVAATIAGGVTKIYIGGVLRATGTWYGINANGQTAVSRIGLGAGTNSTALNAVVSNLRLVEGTAVYTGNFTPPTSKLTAITNTKLLTCQSNRFVDNSSDGLAVTPTGNPAVTAFGPFLTSEIYSAATNGASAYFSSNDSGFTDGTADLLDLGVDADFNFGTGDFSIEYWAYFQGTGGVVFAAHTSGDASGFYNFDNPPRFELFNGGGQVSTGETPPKNSWYHFVLSRQSGTLRVFANGVLKASATNTGSISQDGKRFCVGGILNVSGSNARNYGLKGYLSDFRVVKGSCAAAYQTSSTTNGAVIFTPPTAPLTAITNTKLLLNMKDGQAIDSTAQNNLTLYGTAKTSTAQKKFGTASLLLDGNSDYAEMRYSSLFEIGAGAYTVECFIKTSGGTGEIVGAFNTASPYKGWLFGVGFGSGDGKLKIYNANASNAESVSSTAVVNNNAWRHVAFSKAGQTLKFFIDGNLDSTHTLQYVGVGSEQTIVIGASSNPTRGRFFNGYIDELRVTKATRYTADFTAPSEPFLDKGQ